MQKTDGWMMLAAGSLAILGGFQAIETAHASTPAAESLGQPGESARLAPPTLDGFCGDVLLANHDGTAEGAYSWIFSGSAPPDYGSFAECFEGRFRICEVQFYFTQVGNQAGQTMDVYVWDDLGNGTPGAVQAMVAGYEVETVAHWPETSRHDVEMSTLVDGNWWVGFWGDWPNAQEGWFIAADEDGPGGCPRTKIAPGIGYPTGWEHPDLISSWSQCRSLGIQVQGRNARPIDSLASSAPFTHGGVAVEQRSGGCDDVVLLKHHDGTVENAYAWIYSGVAPPDFGAFAECFEGTYSVCEVQFFLAQIGGYAGQTMDVCIWEDSGVGSPGAVLSILPDVQPGAVAQWPSISQHNFELPVAVSGRWWVGYWGNWPDAEAGWFLAADETGSPGCPRTRIAPGIGYPTGWEHPSTVSAWENCRSLAIQVVANTSSDVEEDPSRWNETTLVAAPNPFVDTVRFSLGVSAQQIDELSIYDVSGREIRRLESSSGLGSGRTQFEWDGRDNGGRLAGNGTYYARMRTASPPMGSNRSEDPNLLRIVKIGR